MTRICKTYWCCNETTKPHTAYCSVHIQYSKLAKNAPTRPHLFYKIEKFVAGETCCELCGIDLQAQYPNQPLKVIAGLFDVDHIDSSTKHTLEGEQPSNYQMICKHCHILKSYAEKDFHAKKYRE